MNERFAKHVRSFDRTCKYVTLEGTIYILHLCKSVALVQQDLKRNIFKLTLLFLLVVDDLIC